MNKDNFDWIAKRFKDHGYILSISPTTNLFKLSKKDQTSHSEGDFYNESQLMKKLDQLDGY